MQKRIIKVRVINPSLWYKEMLYHTFDVYEPDDDLRKEVGYQVATEGRYHGNGFCTKDVVIVNAQAMAFAIPTEDHARFIQQALFDKGYVWASYGNNAKSFHSLNGCKYIATDDRGCIRMCRVVTDIPSNTPFYEAQEVKEVRFSPAETVDIDGTTYLKSHIMKALKLMEGIDV